MSEIKFYKMKLDEAHHPYLAEDRETPYHIDSHYTYRTQDQLYSLAKVMDILDDAEESAYLVCFDVRYRVLGIFCVGSGSSDMCSVSTRNIFQRALMSGAVSIAIWHNHPSGDLTPSGCDIEFTHKLIDAGWLMDIPLVDHLIVSQEGYTSMRIAYPDLRW